VTISYGVTLAGAFVAGLSLGMLLGLLAAITRE